MGVETATSGLADVKLCRRNAEPATLQRQADSILFVRVNRGGAVLETSAAPDGAVERAPLSQGDTYTVPRGHFHRLAEATPDLEVIE